jgi:hypothetical protein
MVVHIYLSHLEGGKSGRIAWGQAANMVRPISKEEKDIERI